jgi:hypothetical protein
MTLKKIDTNPIVQGVARKNKKFRKYLEQLKKKGSTIRKQPKLPGMKKGKDVIVPPKKPKFQSEKDLPRAMRIDTTTSAYGDAGKGRPVPNFKKSKPGKKVGGMTAGSRSALGRLQKAQMDNGGFLNVSPEIKRKIIKEFRKPYRVRQTETKKRIAEPLRPTERTGRRKKTPRPGQPARPFNAGGLVDYYKDII